MIPIIGPPGSYQADLTFYTQYKKSNTNFHILLTVIDINTRYAYIYLAKNKDKNTIESCIK